MSVSSAFLVSSSPMVVPPSRSNNNTCNLAHLFYPYSMLHFCWFTNDLIPNALFMKFLIRTFYEVFRSWKITCRKITLLVHYKFSSEPHMCRGKSRYRQQLNASENFWYCQNIMYSTLGKIAGNNSHFGANKIIKFNGNRLVNSKYYQN